MPINLQEVNRIIAKMAEIEKVLKTSSAHRLEKLFEAKAKMCEGKPPEYEQGYIDGINAGLRVSEIDFETINVEALVVAFQAEPQ